MQKVGTKTNVLLACEALWSNLLCMNGADDNSNIEMCFRIKCYCPEDCGQRRSMTDRLTIALRLCIIYITRQEARSTLGTGSLNFVCNIFSRNGYFRSLREDVAFSRPIDYHVNKVKNLTMLHKHPLNVELYNTGLKSCGFPCGCYKIFDISHIYIFFKLKSWSKIAFQVRRHISTFELKSIASGSNLHTNVLLAMEPGSFGLGSSPSYQTSPKGYSDIFFNII